MLLPSAAGSSGGEGTGVGWDSGVGSVEGVGVGAAQQGPLTQFTDWQYLSPVPQVPCNTTECMFRQVSTAELAGGQGKAG